MLINFFRSNQTLALFTVPFILCLLCLKIIVSGLPVPDIENAMPLFTWIAMLVGKSGFLSVLLVLLLLAFQTYYLNATLSANEVLNKKNNLLLLIFPLLAVALPQFIALTPILFANTLLIVVFSKILSLYKNNNPLPPVFDAGLLIAVASLFYFPALVFMLFLLLGLFVLRPFNWREWVVSFMGFIAPYFLISLYYFWNDKLVFFYTSLLPFNIGAGFKFSEALLPGMWAMLGLLTLLLLLAIGKIQANYYKMAVRSRNYILSLFILLLIGILSVFLSPINSLSALQILALPVAVLIAFYFIHVRRLFMAEVLLILLIISIILSQYKVF